MSKNVLITGASRGIGHATAKKLLIDGSYRVFAISRNIESYKEFKDLYPNNFHYLQKDFFDLKESFVEVYNWISGIAGSLDYLINNAGYFFSSDFVNIKMGEMDKVLKINLIAPAMLIQAMLPFLEKANNAHVLNISSMGGVQGSVKFPGLSFYSTSKGALNILTECLAEEYKDRGIRFNSLALGAVQTEMLTEAFPGYKAPLNADEMADFVIHFMEHGGKYFNGKILPVALSTP